MEADLKKFWEWMEKKGYAYPYGTNFWYLHDKDGDGLSPTKQMLIGYMMEYCFDQGITFNINDTNVYGILEEAICNHDGWEDKKEIS